MGDASVYHEGYEAGVKETLLELEAGSLHKKERIDALHDRIEALEAQLAAVTAERDRLKHDVERLVQASSDLAAENEQLEELLCVTRCNFDDVLSASLLEKIDAVLSGGTALAAVEEGHD